VTKTSEQRAKPPKPQAEANRPSSRPHPGWLLAPATPAASHLDGAEQRTQHRTGTHTGLNNHHAPVHVKISPDPHSPHLGNNAAVLMLGAALFLSVVTHTGPDSQQSFQYSVGAQLDVTLATCRDARCKVSAHRQEHCTVLKSF